MPKKISKSVVHRANRIYRLATSNLRCLPTAIIIGAQKAGTSSLFSYLVQHPEILGSSTKEVHFFDGGLQPEIDTYKRGEKWYRSHFPYQFKDPQVQHVIEASPFYLFHPLCAPRIASLLPDVRLIVLLRNPTDRAISNYLHECRGGRERRSMRDAFLLEEKLLAPIWRQEMYSNPRFNALSYKARGRYAEQIKRYLKYFRKEQLLVLKSEDMFEQPECVLEKIFMFLNVDPSYEVQDISPRNVTPGSIECNNGVYEYLEEYFRPYNEDLVRLIGSDASW